MTEARPAGRGHAAEGRAGRDGHLRRLLGALSLSVLALLLPARAAGQLAHLRPAGGEPTGIAVPGLSVASAEEATAVEANPAGAGFVGGPSLHYFHQGRGGGRSADGFWSAAPLGPLVPSLSMQWVRPGGEGGAHFRKTTWGLALSDGRVASLGAGWNLYASPEPSLDELSSLDLGLTLRPWRHLSVGFAVRGLEARRAGARLPLHYDAGIATRLLGERLTLSAALLTNDQGRGDLLADAITAGAALALPLGLTLGAELALPLDSNRGGRSGATQALLALTFDAPHAGATVGAAAGDGVERTWLAGVRLSAERYRGEGGEGAVPLLDLAELLSPPVPFFAREEDPYGDLLRRLWAARDDPAVSAVALRIDALPLGAARFEELRAIVAATAARKPVVALLLGGGLRELDLASAASAVLAAPPAAFFPLGLAATTPFLAGGFDKLGVGFDVVAAGAYKSAPEPLVRDDMSPAQREVTESVLDDLSSRLLGRLAAARKVPEERLRSAVDQGLLSASQVVQLGLADRLAWPDEVEEAASRLLGGRARLARGWKPAPLRAARRWGPREAVALLRVEGVIAPGKSRRAFTGRVAGSDTLCELIRRAVDDGRVKALVVRVESPGGDGLASDLVWRELMLARRAGKPVVISMGDLAASGGYLVASAADAILAEPSTLTGSIGAFVVKPDLSALLAKLGVNVVTLRRGERADLESLARPWTPGERAEVGRQLAAFYDTFLDRVAEGRGLGREKVEGVAGGRVWTGAQALQRGLVDQLGSLGDALALAQKKAGSAGEAPFEVVALEPEQGLLGRLPLAPLLAAREAPLERWAARIPEVRALSLLEELGPVVALHPGWLGAPELPGASAPR